MTRGGKRPGAGRPANPEGKKRAIQVYLPPDLVAWLDEQVDSRSTTIIKALEREK